MRQLAAIVIVLVALAGGSASAQLCEHRFRVTLGDGSIVCLDRHPLGKVSIDSGMPLAARLPNNGIYAIHVARGASCPRSPRLYIPYHAGVNRRHWMREALADCEANVRELAPAHECKCRRLVVNQFSTLKPKYFDRWGDPDNDR